MTHMTEYRRGFIGAALVLVVSAAAAAQTTIYPPPGTPGGDYIIAVVSDGYTDSESWKFDRAVSGLLLNGLMADPFYANRGSKFTIVKLFKGVPPSQQSSFGIALNYDISKCYIDYDHTTTTKAIEDAVAAIAPERTIVIGNYEGVALGCSVDTWTFISAGAREVEGVLEHEGGHLIAGLDDEFALPENVDYTTPSVNGPNCSNVFDSAGNPDPIWKQPTSSCQTPPPVEECRLFQKKIVRAYATCRMRSDGPDFCCVCAEWIDRVLAQYGATKESRARTPATILQAGFLIRPAAFQAPASAPAQKPSVRLLVRLTKKNVNDANGGTALIIAATEVKAPTPHRYVRTGDYVYGIIDGSTVLESAVLPGDPFQQRAFGSGGAPHGVESNNLSATVTVMIPNRTRAELLAHPVGVKFIRLEPTESRDNLDPDRFKSLTKPPLAELSPADVRKALDATPPAKRQ